MVFVAVCCIAWALTIRPGPPAPRVVVQHATNLNLHVHIQNDVRTLVVQPPALVAKAAPAPALPATSAGPSKALAAYSEPSTSVVPSGRKTVA